MLLLRTWKSSAAFGAMGADFVCAVLSVVALLLSTVECDVNCNGRPGELGPPGRDGLAGMKGQKGEPAVWVDDQVDPNMLLRLKGDKGNSGPHGPIGPQGYRGNVGAAGAAGRPGPPGPAGVNRNAGQSLSNQGTPAAFSVKRNVAKYPPFNQKITYQEAIVNTGNSFDINTGIFTCRTPGFYYFTFHSVAKVSMCLALVKEGEAEKIVFCDENVRNSDQVLSGGVVLELTAGQKVWLESYRDQQQSLQIQKDADARDVREKLIIFNGFLIFSNS
ncbi:complement C1q subcomponent subunit A-like [Poeciliopsis prolifica]|uniref:complement C1q subcomponent subunit A-like n=1 Tax=Poeciliopsis prolifica TaxID=188132 RepID=UPI002413A8E4|nr:complement C1q subcomponent subunit A-like [Poeciliopsis prolifica]